MNIIYTVENIIRQGEVILILNLTSCGHVREASVCIFYRHYFTLQKSVGSC